MKKQTIWIAVGVLIAIPLIPTILSFIGNIFSSIGVIKVDDWIYGGASLSSMIAIGWAEIGLIGKAIAVSVTALVIAYIGFPLYKFAQGLIKKEPSPELGEGYNEHDSPEWKRHYLWLGAPAVFVVSLLYVAWVIYVFKLYKSLFSFDKSLFSFVENNVELVIWTLWGISIFLMILIARLFFGGLYSWIRNHGNDVIRKTGRNKFLFSFYYIGFFFIVIAPWATINLMTYSTGLSSSSVSVPMAPGGGALSNPLSAKRGFSPQSDTIGLAVGGANDINNFRENINNGYLPIPTDITHEGIFYDYTFDTGLQEECTDLFCPSYTTAVSPDPFSSSTEYFLSVGLNSGIKQEDFERKKLNLVIVLDISGSMRSSFNRYYYDQFRKDNENVAVVEEVDNRSKMEIANESVVALLDHLDEDDRFGMVVFESSAYTAKGLRSIKSTDMTAIKNHILEIAPRNSPNPTGGTNMEAGYRAGTELLQEFKDLDKDKYENRIIFLTDAMPNTGQISEEGLFGLTKQNADDGVYTTFVGVGVDFNTELINKITQTKGANYYSVHSAKDFIDRMDNGFDYMVTPLVFDLVLKLESEGYDIRAVYGSPEADLSTGELMRVNTLFPSERTSEETRGGLVLLHLKKLTDDAKLKLGVKYKNRSGEQFSNEQNVRFNSDSEELYYANSGIHKGVVLSRYVNTMKDWTIHEAERAPEAQIEIPIMRYTEDGIPVMGLITELGQWERTSNRLSLSNEYYPIITRLREYLVNEIKSIGDDSMKKEIDLLDKIMTTNTSSPVIEN